MDESPLEAAVRIAGGQSQLARKASAAASPGRKLTQAMVWKWLNRARGPVPPAEWVIPIELATGVSRHDLRIDIYPMKEVA